MKDRVVSLAAGVLPEFDPATAVDAAAAAGFPAVGIWFDPTTWTDSVGRVVRHRLDASGLVALDIEPVFVGPEGDNGFQLIDAAEAIGARHVLTVSDGLAVPRFAERFGQLCDRAAPAGIRVVVEFTRLYTIASLTDALEVLGACARPNAGILVDNLHLQRCGHAPSDLEGIDPGWLPYVQLSDATIEPVDPSRDGLLTEARHGRRNLGDGELPLAEFLAAFAAETPVSLEVRSRSMRQAFTDPRERARAVMGAYRRLVAQADA